MQVCNHISWCKSMKKNQTHEHRCPLCGQGTTRVQKIDYKLNDENGKEFVVPDLEVEVCDFCGERIFNMDAVSKARRILGSPHKILIRLKPELHDTLVTRAQKSRRSLTEEAEHLLAESLREAN